MTNLAYSKSERPGQILAWWIGVVRRVAIWVVLVSTLATGGILYYAIKHLGIDTNTDAMLSETLPFRRNYEDFKKAFPQDISTILLVIDGATPDLAQHASMALASQLEKKTDLVSSVYVPGGGRFFEEHGLLYLSPPELEDMADHLASAQPFLAKLILDPSLRGLFSMLGTAVDGITYREEFDLTPVFDRVSEGIEATLNQRHYQLSWQELMMGRLSTPDERRRFIMIEPRLDFSKLQPAEETIKAIRHLAKELQLDEAHGVRLRISGDIALDHDELQTISRGAGTATLLSFALVVILLFIGFGSLWLLFATLVTLIFGLVWTAGFATLVVGHLNLFSVTFAILYIGMAVDYSIHFCLRYKELVQLGTDPHSALSAVGRGVGSSLITGTIVLVIGFYAFLPTSFRGVSELGLITGTGMFIGLFATLTVLPALLELMPLPQQVTHQLSPGRLGAIFGRLTSWHARAIRVVALVLGLAALPLLSRITFDYSPLKLKDPTTESVSTFNELLEQSTASPWTITVLAPNPGAARQYADHLSKLAPVDKTVTLDDFIPAMQEEKLAIIENISLIMGLELLQPKQAPLPGDREQTSALNDFQEKLESFLRAGKRIPFAASASRLGRDLAVFNSTLNSQASQKQSQMLEDLETSLLGSLPSQLQSLRASLESKPITIHDLPQSLVKRWVAKDGRYRIEVFPRENLNNDVALRHFVNAVRTVTPNITGFPVIILEAGNAVTTAFKQASLWSLIAIIVLLLILLPKKSDSLLVLLPLVLAWVLTGAIMVALNIPFNFANVIDVPLLLGYGANSGIYMLYRSRAGELTDDHVLQTSTTRAVIFCALTTFASFANLSVSSHPGLASMGKLLTIGLGLILCCDLIVLPALLHPRAKAHSSSRGLDSWGKHA